MKKILFVLCLLASTNAHALTHCEDAGGQLWTGRDGKTQYCTGKNSMNWWSAHSWCQEVGGTLFDMSKECGKANKYELCPQVSNFLSKINAGFWTIHTGSDGKARTITYGDQTGSISKNSGQLPLCTLE